MQDRELTERPGRGWTKWAEGAGEYDIERVWWMAIRLHHPKLNTTTYWDGSSLVAIEHWGYRGEKWCMKHKPADWQPLPEVYRREREREQQEALTRYRVAAEARMLATLERTGRRQSTPDASAAQEPAAPLCTPETIALPLRAHSDSLKVGG